MNQISLHSVLSNPESLTLECGITFLFLASQRLQLTVTSYCMLVPCNSHCITRHITLLSHRYNVPPLHAANSTYFYVANKTDCSSSSRSTIKQLYCIYIFLFCFSSFYKDRYTLWNNLQNLIFNSKEAHLPSDKETTSEII